MQVTQGGPCRGYQVCIPLLHINDPDLWAARTVGIIPWHRGKVKDNHSLNKAPPESSTTFRPIRPTPLPYEILEMIVTHLTYNRRTLKACSLTCRSWYTAAAPRLHHTITLRGDIPEIGRSQLEPLSRLHQLGLAPLVKEIRVRRYRGGSAWFAPQGFSSHVFFDFANIQVLRLEEPDIHLIPGIEHSFECFSPTLRSIALRNPRCSPRRLSHFLSFFPNLDDIEIKQYKYVPNSTIPDTEFVPFSAPKLRGRLALYDFPRIETWTDLIASCSGLRFRYMDLRCTVSCAPILLEACAKTLDTLRFSVTDGSVGE